MFHRIGKNVSLALQSFSELQPYSEDNAFIGFGSKELLDLGAAPVLFHLQNDPELLRYIGDCDGDVDALDFKKVVS